MVLLDGRMRYFITVFTKDLPATTDESWKPNLDKTRSVTRQARKIRQVDFETHWSHMHNDPIAAWSSLLNDVETSGEPIIMRNVVVAAVADGRFNVTYWQHHFPGRKVKHVSDPNWDQGVVHRGVDLAQFPAHEDGKRFLLQGLDLFNDDVIRHLRLPPQPTRFEKWLGGTALAVASNDWDQPFHAHPDTTVHFSLYGATKRWVLIQPSDVIPLRPYMTTRVPVLSPYKLRMVNDKHVWEQLERWDVTVNPGDVLILPPWTVHAVEYTNASHNSLGHSVAFVWGPTNLFASLKRDTLLTLMWMVKSIGEMRWETWTKIANAVLVTSPLWWRHVDSGEDLIDRISALMKEDLYV